MRSAIPFIIIALCAGMYFVYISPTITDIGVKNERKAEYDNVIGRIKELNQQRDSLSTKYNNISRDDIDKLNKIIPGKFDSTYFTNDLNSIASGHGMLVDGVVISNIDLVPDINGQPIEVTYKTISVKFKLSGTYDQFLNFLKDLESSLRLMDVVDLTARSDPKSNNLNYTLEIYTYALE